MPFIIQERREIIAKKGLNGLYNHPKSWVEPGDRCYVFYKEMVDRWKTSPRWTTVHEIYRDVIDNSKEGEYVDAVSDDEVARQLAWQVFFQLYVIPYELKKREENGDI